MDRDHAIRCVMAAVAEPAEMTGLPNCCVSSTA